MPYKIITTIGILAIVAVVAIIGTSQTMSHSEYKDFVDNPGNPPVGIFKFDSGKVEIATKTDGCDYGLYRIEGSKITIKCGYRIAADFDILTEYYTTYGEDRWLRNDKKRTLITTDIQPAEDGQSIKVIQRIPYYKKSGFKRYGQDGILSVTYDIVPERVKISLDYDVENDAIHHIMLRQNVLTDKAFFDPTDPRGQLTMKLDDLYIYGDRRGDLSIDPTIQIGNLSASTIQGNFYSGFCENCEGRDNISMTSGLTATYTSGWIESQDRAELINMTSNCYQVDGGWCSYSIRTGSNIYAENDSNTYIRCNMSNTLHCSSVNKTDAYNLSHSGISYKAGSINGLTGVLVNESDYLYINVNQTRPVEWNVSLMGNDNTTINVSKGTMELVFIPEWSS